MTIKLFTHPRSRGRVARWMLEETGAPYESVWLEYGESMHADAYRAINPMTKVPAIQHGETVVTEAAAICAYLADAFPDAGLAPTGADRGAWYRWFFFAAGPLEAAIINQALGVTLKPEQEGFAGYGSMQRVLDTLEGALGDGWLAGDRFTAVDLYVGSQLGFGLQFGTIEKRPAFVAYAKRATDREAYRRAAAIDDAKLAEAG